MYLGGETLLKKMAFDKDQLLNRKASCADGIELNCFKLEVDKSEILFWGFIN